MKIQVETSERTIQRINMILSHALEEIKKDDLKSEYFDCKDKDFKSIESFRIKMLKSAFPGFKFKGK